MALNKEALKAACHRAATENTLSNFMAPNVYNHLDDCVFQNPELFDRIAQYYNDAEKSNEPVKPLEQFKVTPTPVQ